MRWEHLSTSLTIKVAASLQSQLQGQRSRVIVSHRRKTSGTMQAFSIHRVPALGLSCHALFPSRSRAMEHLYADQPAPGQQVIAATYVRVFLDKISAVTTLNTMQIMMHGLLQSLHSFMSTHIYCQHMV